VTRSRFVAFVDREDVREDRRAADPRTEKRARPSHRARSWSTRRRPGPRTHRPAPPHERCLKARCAPSRTGGSRPHRISSRVTHIWVSRRARPAVHVSHRGCTENGAVVGRLRPKMLGNRQRIAVFTAVPCKQGTLRGRQGTLPLRSLTRPCSPSWPDDSTADRRDSLPSTLTCVPMALGGRPDATRAA
jgi:hypothetical protein